MGRCLFVRGILVHRVLTVGGFFLGKGEIYMRTSSQSVVEFQRVKSYSISRAASIPLYVP